MADIAHAVRAREHEFALELYSIEQAIQETTRHAAPRGRPIILADTQDNPGGGGNADTMARILGDAMGKSLGQRVILVAPDGDVQNRVIFTAQDLSQGELAEASNRLNRRSASLRWRSTSARIRNWISRREWT